MSASGIIDTGLLQDAAALLGRTTGLDIEAVGRGAIERAVSLRMQACGCSDARSYRRILEVSEIEREELIDGLVVPETWFFRYREPFVYLRHFIMTEWNPAAGRKLFVLSAPCSTGEEPYSIAILLNECGLDREVFCIDALDISRNAITTAERAVYGRNSFRCTEPAFRDLYFSETQDGHRLHDSIRESVSFVHGNLLDPPRAELKSRYDIIFCRNLLIYLNEDSRHRIITLLDSLLNRDGLLFLGHTETTHMLKYDYTPVPHPRAFAYIKRAAPAPVERMRATEQRQAACGPRVKAAGRQKPPAPRSRMPHGSAPVPSASAAPAVLADAHCCADRGDLEDAVNLCTHYLDEHGPSPEAYYLLGVISESRGNTREAEDYFEKTLYLDPDKYEAVLHLALLMEKLNNTGRAAVLRQRARRIAAATSP